MKRSLLLAILVVVALPYGFSATGSMAQDSEKKKPQTLKVKSAPIKIYEEVKGTVESKAMTEVKTDTKSWSELKVKDVVAQGAKVSQGDKLVVFDTEKIDQKIAESKYALDLATLAFNQAKLAHEQFLATYEMDVEMAERTWKDAKDDHDYFMNVTMPRSKKSAEFSLKGSLWSVENAREELEQLEKMYKEDELTEESELIVLKRAQRSLERSEFFLDSAKVSTKRQVDVTIPRQVVSAKDSHRRAELTYEKQKITLPMMRKQKEIELEKARFALEKQKRDFEKLTADREKMVLASPASGTLYYGKCSRGAWAGVSGGATRKLNVGTVVPGQESDYDDCRSRPVAIALRPYRIATRRCEKREVGQSDIGGLSRCRLDGDRRKRRHDSDDGRKVRLCHGVGRQRRSAHARNDLQSENLDLRKQERHQGAEQSGI